MLPPAHLAAGYLAANLAVSSLHYNFSPEELRNLLLLGTFIGFAPDLDFFYAFWKTKSLRIENDKVVHRKFFTHAPLVWFAAGLLIFAFGQTEFTKAVGLLVWLCSWSHFVIDAEWGIPWLWPFSKRLMPFSSEYYAKKYAKERPNEPGFFRYWWNIVYHYYVKERGWIEVVIILISLVYLFK